MDGSLVFVGVVVTFIVEIIKRYFGTSRTITMLTVIVLSLIGGLLSWYLQKAGLLDSFIQIASVSALVYSFVIKNTEIIVEEAEKRYNADEKVEE